MTTDNQDDNSENPYSVSSASLAVPAKRIRKTIHSYILLALVVTFVAILEGAAQLRWHPISRTLLGFLNAYPMMIATLLPPAFAELCCRRSKRFNNLLLSIVGSAARIFLLFGIFLFLAVNVAFYSMTGEAMFTVTYPYDRSNIPAYACAIGSLVASVLFIAYDAIASIFSRPTKPEPAGTKP